MMGIFIQNMWNSEELLGLKDGYTSSSKSRLCVYFCWFYMYHRFAIRNVYCSIY